MSRTPPPLTRSPKATPPPARPKESLRDLLSNGESKLVTIPVFATPSERERQTRNEAIMLPTHSSSSGQQSSATKSPGNVKPEVEGL